MIDLIKMWFAFCKHQIAVAIICFILTPFVWSSGWICGLVLLIVPTFDFLNICKEIYNGEK